MTGQDNIIELRGVDKSFEDTRALEGIDLSISNGEFLTLLGPSGCGKTTILRILSGFETPDQGDVSIGGQRMNDVPPERRQVNTVFQNYALFPHMTVRDNVAFGLRMQSCPKGEIEGRVLEALRMVHLEQYADRRPHQLSGGQQQRVALARMLAARPGILMLDEPFSALDAHLKSSLEQNLIGLFKEYEGTVLYVSHDIDEAFRFCDRIAVVDSGRIDEIGSNQAIVESPGSLAAIKLSGCKNTTEAAYVDASTVHLPQWGIRVKSARPVPQDVRYFGVRAFFLQRAEGPGENVFRMRADRVSDSRFERTVMLGFLDAEQTPQRLHDVAEEDETMKFLRTHLQWRVDKLKVGFEGLPQEGDELFIRIPPEAIYLVSR